jgi:ubiquinone/menaquinone biosynthesis C-methylase UbiE
MLPCAVAQREGLLRRGGVLDIGAPPGTVHAMDPDIAAHYALGLEADRLFTWGRLERVRTEALLERHLPSPPATVLDVGGGPGAYALWLARRGYDVRLIDPIELHVAQAREASARQPDAPLASIDLGDARALAANHEAADAVLLLGPLYHLTDPADRARALREALRVLRPGGVLAAAAISRFAATLDGLLKGALDDPAFEAIVERSLRDGRHRNPERRPEWFTTAFFHLPGELENEVRAAGFALEALVAVEGVGAILADPDAWLDDPARRATLMRAIARVESEPSLLGASPHLLAIGRRPHRTD